MGSGGSQTLWSPSYEAGAGKRNAGLEIVHLVNQAYDDHPTPMTTRAVIDGGTLKRK